MRYNPWMGRKFYSFILLHKSLSFVFLQVVSVGHVSALKCPMDEDDETTVEVEAAVDSMASIEIEASMEGELFGKIVVLVVLTSFHFQTR